MFLLALGAGLAPAQGPSLGSPVDSTTLTIPVPIPPAPTTQIPSAIVPVRFQSPGRSRPRPGDDERRDYQIQLEPPGLERLSLVVANDASLQERIRQETLSRDPNERVVFPDEPILSRQRYYGRGGIWPQRGMIVEPNYVCYDRLFFEEKNSERFGWEIGMLQPFLSAGQFYKDIALLPLHCFADPCGKSDCSAGHCLPGDPVPYRLYPPGVTVSGTVAEVAVILALVAIFP